MRLISKCTHLLTSLFPCAMAPIYDCVIVGAGIEGSATAYQLARSGKRTLLLEQFSLLHTNGSSHGGSRIIRRAYGQECYAEMTSEAYKEWHIIEELSGKTVYKKTGLVYFGKQGSSEVENVIQFLGKYNAIHHALDHSELLAAMPRVNFSQDNYGVYDEIGGILLADKALACIQELYEKQGGEILENCKVVDIHTEQQIVTLDTTRGQFQAKSVALCPGTWGAGDLMTRLGLKLPITPLRSYALYWKEDVQGSYSAAKGMPCFIDCHSGVYGIPSFEQPGYTKVCNHGGYAFHDIDEPNVHEDKPPYNLEFICKYVKEHFPGLSQLPAIVQKCKYAETPDELCILDTHPKFRNIVIATGFSGTGFKLAPVIGNILRDLVTNQKPKYDLKPFAINRFVKDTK